ncbi:MAG: outer membrane lipoprotein-sorting protein [Gammaproteobacteria bacterium]|nr:outer membrane lipoprotein-sorting protein [Gammaproteobacteria bacterium]
MKLYPIATLLLILLLSFAAHAESDAEALALLHKSEALMRSAATAAEYQVDIIRPDWQRTMTFKSMDDNLKKRFRMEILSPRKTKGTVFLKIDNKLSMYLPKLRRQIAISPAMMHDAWMGSDFNNQDLLEADALINGYTHRITGRQGTGDQTVISIESVPHAETTVSWLRLEHRIRSDGMPIDVTYICRRGNPARKLSFDRYQEMDDRTIPTRWSMESLKEEGKRTIITLKSIDFDTQLDEAAFTPMKKSPK